MGCDSCISGSNSLKSDSEISSNSGIENGIIETMEFSSKNSGTIIRRVWIIKRAITLNDRNVKLFKYGNFLERIIDLYSYCLYEDLEIEKPKVNIFKIENTFNSYFKHWAIILELSNNTYVNIQFGRNGISLKEFNETKVKGGNILNSIIYTWGEEGLPVSFCYLGYSNYEYNKLKDKLKKIKDKETKNFNENGKTYYNCFFKNCQHLVCDIEKILFNGIHIYHFFDFYLDDFFKYFFTNIDLNNLKIKYNELIEKENKKIYEDNLIAIENFGEKLSKRNVPNGKINETIYKYRKKIEKMFDNKK